MTVESGEVAIRALCTSLSSGEDTHIEVKPRQAGIAYTWAPGAAAERRHGERPCRSVLLVACRLSAHVTAHIW